MVKRKFTNSEEDRTEAAKTQKKWLAAVSVWFDGIRSD